MRSYTASPDRAGLALLAGGLVGGLVAGALAAIDAGPAPGPVLVASFVGTIVTLLLALAVAGPVWLACHARGWRGPGVAAAVGGSAGFALLLAAQTYGFGLAAMPATDARTLAFRWISAVATSVPPALVCALIGWTMWRVAYRRAGR